MSITTGTLSRAVLKAIGSLALASVVLCQVAAHSGPQNGIAYVHVTTPEVDVLIDGQSHHIDTLWDSPIVCELALAGTRWKCPEMERPCTSKNSPSAPTRRSS